jgi:hypothetical protein
MGLFTQYNKQNFFWGDKTLTTFHSNFFYLKSGQRPWTLMFARQIFNSNIKAGLNAIKWICICSYLWLSSYPFHTDGCVMCPHPFCQVTVSEQGQNVLSTLSFVGPSRDGTNKLSPGDRGHYSCQFENQVLCMSSEFHSVYVFVQYTWS